MSALFRSFVLSIRSNVFRRIHPGGKFQDINIRLIFSPPSIKSRPTVVRNLFVIVLVMNMHFDVKQYKFTRLPVSQQIKISATIY